MYAEIVATFTISVLQRVLHFITSSPCTNSLPLRLLNTPYFSRKCRMLQVLSKTTHLTADQECIWAQYIQLISLSFVCALSEGPTHTAIFLCKTAIRVEVVLCFKKYVLILY